MALTDWMSPITAGVDFATGQLTAKQQYERTKKLMEIQNKNQQAMMSQQQLNQMELNKQGQEMQYEMWQKTNYPAQVGMLREAGLNPALLYGKGGGGGTTTGSQGGGAAAGGSAAMGSVQQAKSMDIMNAMAMNANIELMKANAEKARAEAKKIGGVDTELGTTQISKLIAETQNEALRGDLMKVQTALTGIQAANTEQQIKAGVNKLIAETNESNLRQKLTTEQFNSLVEEAKQRAIGQTLENELTQAKTSLTEAEKRSVTTGILQKWNEIWQRGEQINIEKFKAEMAAEYPGTFNVIGGIIKKSYDALESLDNFKKAIKGEPVVDKVGK